MNAVEEVAKPLELALCQIDPIVGDLAGNADMILEWAAHARESGAELALFPELALSGYPPEDLVLREDFLAAAETQLARIARDSPDLTLMVGFPHAGADGVANALAVVRGGGVETVYRKHLLPNYGVFDERRYFLPGEEFSTVSVGGTKIGLSVCEDIWFDSPVFDELARTGAQLVVNASASPFHAGKSFAREEMLRQRAKRFGLPVAYCNMTGGQDELVFDGASVVIGAGGEVLARAPQFQPALLRCTLPAIVDAGATDAESLTPLLGPRENEVYRALMTGICDYVEKNGFPGVLVGVSGGIDSALVLTLACDALGPGRVTGVMMPSPFNRPETRADAYDLIARLGCSSHEFAIEPVMDAFERVLAEPFAGLAADATEENVQARIRGTLLMALSNKFSTLVLTTGNKSEMAVGYATLYGDMAGGFAALKDVPKQLVFALSRWRNENTPLADHAVSPIPETIISRPPSAELRHGQTDEDSLGSYELLDEVIERYIERDQGIEEIVASGIDREYALRTLRMIDLAEYKRRQAPPGVKITPRAFGRDRRMPITAKRRYS